MDMNLSRREVQNALLDVARLIDRAEAGAVRDVALGICANLSDTAADLVRGLARGWSDHSGDPDFPIPGGHHTFMNTANLWEGEQLAYRLSLLRHMQAKLETMLANAAEAA